MHNVSFCCIINTPKLFIKKELRKGKPNIVQQIEAMKIIRLGLISFGRFQNKIIDFSEGINLIFGTDSAADETVRAFIQAMLFGADDKLLAQYSPKSGAFTGTMRLDDQGREITVERDFHTGIASVKDESGRNITTDYTDSRGVLHLMPLDDTIYYDTPRVRTQTSKDTQSLSKLKDKRRKLKTGFNYQRALKTRKKLVAGLADQSSVAQEIEDNKRQITMLEAEIDKITEANHQADAREQQEMAELTENAKRLKAADEAIGVQIAELRAPQVRVQVLEQSAAGMQQRADTLTDNIQTLSAQKEDYAHRIAELKNHFKLDRNTLRADKEKYEYAAGVRSSKKDFVQTLLALPIWADIVMAAAGALLAAVAVYNPESMFSQNMIFLLSFVGVFFAATGIFFFAAGGKPVPQPVSPVPLSAAEAVLQKYHQPSGESFLELCTKAEGVFDKLDDMKEKLADTEAELARAQSQYDQCTNDLAGVSAGFEEIAVETQQNPQIEALKQQRADIAEQNLQNEAAMAAQRDKKAMRGSVWSIREEIEGLKETNSKLSVRLAGFARFADEFDRLQNEIDRYESVIIGLDQQIETEQARLKQETEQAIAHFAEPGDTDYTEKMLVQYGFGLRKLHLCGAKAPLITLNPFETAGSSDAVMVEKFAGFVKGKQTLVFSSTGGEGKLFKNNQVPYNGILVL